MKKRQSCMAGFTMAEVIVAMTVSALLTGLALNALASLLNTGTRLGRQYSESDKIIRTYTLIKEITFAASEIYATENQIDFIDGEEKVSLFFSQSFILFSKGPVSDSVHCNLTKIQMLNEPDTDLITRFSFTIISGKLEYPFEIKKEYPSAVIHNLKNQ